MNFLFDTNIVLHYLRKSSTRDKIEMLHKPSDPRNKAVVSVVSVGELRSIALQNNWGLRKLAELEEFLAEFLIADINTEAILEKYARIDAFSQGKLPGQPLGTSARNMGKNDLWIAATASVLNLRLLTTDADFDHLDKVFLDLALLKSVNV